MAKVSLERLSSWKEIASFLRLDVRTAQRWERDFGLPVHRPARSGGYSVFAYPDELNAWLKGRRGQSPAAAEDVRVAAAIGRGRSGRGWLLVAAVIAAFGLGFGAYGVWLYYYGGPPARVEFSGNELMAWNERGRLLWPYDFGHLLRHDMTPPETGRIRIVNLGPDRQQNVLAVAPLFVPDRANSPSDALYDFSANGKLRWHYSFDDKPQFGGHRYDSPWVSSTFLVTGPDAAPSIWCSALQDYSSVSTLIRFDRDGNKLAQFVNWGHIDSLNHVREASGSYILAGGISNQCNCAFVAVLQEDHGSGSSPALSPAFQCDNCPAGKPYRYLLFPRSELTELSGTAYNNTKLIRVDGGHVSLGVSETASPEVPGPDWERYDLSDDFVPQSVWISDHFWTLHREMEVEGKIDHSVEQCPERTQPQTVRMWSPETGWKDIKVPVVPVPR